MSHPSAGTRPAPASRPAPRRRPAAPASEPTTQTRALQTVGDLCAALHTDPCLSRNANQLGRCYGLDPGDVNSNAAVRILGRKTGDLPSNPMPFLRQTQKWSALDLFRKKLADRLLQQLPATLSDADPDHAEPTVQDPGPETVDCDDLFDSLAKYLTPDETLVLKKTFVDGLSTADLAARLDRSERTVHRLRMRALRKARDLMPAALGTEARDRPGPVARTHPSPIRPPRSPSMTNNAASAPADVLQDNFGGGSKPAALIREAASLINDLLERPRHRFPRGLPEADYPRTPVSGD